MMKDDKRNKALEFMLFNQATHSLVAVRAYECTEWTKGETFANITALSKCVSVLDSRNALLPILKGYKYCVGESCETVLDAFVKSVYNNVSVNRVTVCEKKHKHGKVVSISIDGNTSFDKGIWVLAKLSVLSKEGSVLKILIEGATKFKEGDWVHQNSVISIVYHSAKQIIHN